MGNAICSRKHLCTIEAIALLNDNDTSIFLSFSSFCDVAVVGGGGGGWWLVAGDGSFV